jgi:hypothetical protein
MEYGNVDWILLAQLQCFWPSASNTREMVFGTLFAFKVCGKKVTTYALSYNTICMGNCETSLAVL